MTKYACIALTFSLAILSPTARADDDARLDKAVKAVQGWQYGRPHGELDLLAKAVVEASRDPAASAEMEKRMLAGLAGATTRGGKGFFCRQLVLVGTGASVDALAKLLGDPESSHMARYALERIPGKAADQALLGALARADAPLKVGLVHSLGRRRCDAAAEDVADLLTSDDANLVRASLVALARMDPAAARRPVTEARGRLTGRLRAAATDAMLTVAGRLDDAGDRDDARAIYTKLFAAGEPGPCRVAAMKGLIADDDGTRGLAVAIDALDDDDPLVRNAAVPALRDVPGRAVTEAIAAELGRQKDPAVRVQLLGVLADREDPAALPAVIDAAREADDRTLAAALDALAVLGDAKAARLLCDWAAGADDARRRNAARDALGRLRGKGVNDALGGLLDAADGAVRGEAARALGARGATGAVAALLARTDDKDPAVRREVYAALAALADDDRLSDLAALLAAEADDDARDALESALVAVARRTDSETDAAKAVLAADKPGDATVHAAAVRVLGRLGDPAGLDTVLAAADDPREPVKDAAVRALADWPTAAPAGKLAALAADKDASQTHRVLALRGYIGMIHQQEGASDERIVGDYARALEIARRNEEKQLVLSRLSGLRHRQALEIARRCAKDPALKSAAETAAKKIEELLAAPASVTASHNLDKAGNAIDDDPKTRWDTGSPQQGGEWFKLQLDEQRLITGIVLDARGSNGDYPRGYKVYISPTSLGAGKLVAEGKGSGAVTKIKLDKPVRGKAIKIVQTGQAGGLYWSIHEIEVQSRPAGQ